MKYVHRSLLGLFYVLIVIAAVYDYYSWSRIIVERLSLVAGGCLVAYFVWKGINHLRGISYDEEKPK